MTSTLSNALQRLHLSRSFARHAQQPPHVRDAAQITIDLPADQYMHNGAPTEWWWHTGTLRAADGRVFGFEINAASFTGQPPGVRFTQVMLTDVAGKRHFRQTKMYLPPFTDWAQVDPTQDWFVKLESPGSRVVMAAPWWETLTNMHVEALLTDEANLGTVEFDLVLSQEGPPLIVWGTGASPSAGPTPEHLKNNNYYYSLTNLHASGTITINGEQIAVTGVTWMDHEYGLFQNHGQAVVWTLQDMQLSNGVCISNYFVPGEQVLEPGKTAIANATILTKAGTSIFVPTELTPGERTWTSPDSGNTYFLDFTVAIPEYPMTKLYVSTLFDDQEFRMQTGTGKVGGIYEGVASVTGHFMHEAVTGTAWNEQAPPSA